MKGMNVPQENPPLPPWRSALSYAACYLSWLVYTALGFGLFWLLRTNLFDLSVWLRLNPWQVRGIDRFAIFFLGLLWFVGVIVLEQYLRKGIETNQLWRRIARVGIVLALVAALSYSLQFIL
jgi:hypothetical protein